jgi:hypothetical protein
MNNNIKSNLTTNKILQRDLNILEQYFIIVLINLQQFHHVRNPFAKACGVLGFVNVEPHQLDNHRAQN